MKFVAALFASAALVASTAVGRRGAAARRHRRRELADAAAAHCDPASLCDRRSLRTQIADVRRHGRDRPRGHQADDEAGAQRGQSRASRRRRSAGKGGAPLVAKVTTDERPQTATFDFGRTIAPGQYRLDIGLFGQDQHPGQRSLRARLQEPGGRPETRDLHAVRAGRCATLRSELGRA